MGGIAPLSWETIDAWMRVTQTELEVDDVLLLRQLSKAYVSAYYEGEDQNAPAPYVDDEVAQSEANADAVTEQLKAWANSFPKNR